MFERVDYRVERIDGDYAYLKRTDVLDDDEKCVARALLPGDINEGSRLAYAFVTCERGPGDMNKRQYG